MAEPLAFGSLESEIQTKNLLGGSRECWVPAYLGVGGLPSLLNASLGDRSGTSKCPGYPVAYADGWT